MVSCLFPPYGQKVVQRGRELVSPSEFSSSLRELFQLPVFYGDEGGNFGKLYAR